MARLKQTSRTSDRRVKSGRVLKTAVKRTFYQYPVGMRDVSFMHYSLYGGNISDCDLIVETLHTVGADADGNLHYKCKFLKFETLPLWFLYQGEPRITALIEAFREASVDVGGIEATNFWLQVQQRRRQSASNPQVWTC